MEEQAEKTAFQRRLMQRRTGKDRRKHIDPRYRNPDYPEFCDRRKGERREPEYEDRRALIEEHPNRKWVAVVGIVGAIFLMFASLLTNVGISTRLETKKIGNIETLQVFPRMLPWLF